MTQPAPSFKVHVTYKNGVEVDVITSDETTSDSFWASFQINPEVAEITQSRKGKVGYRHIRTITNSSTTLPL